MNSANSLKGIFSRNLLVYQKALAKQNSASELTSQQ